MMPKPLRLVLDEKRVLELKQVRDHDPEPYLREKAAALLKISAGQSGRAVARQGLLRPRRPDTVYEWVRRYQADGIAGLRVKAGRGRKPAFSP
jgi:transposase